MKLYKRNELQTSDGQNGEKENNMCQLLFLIGFLVNGMYKLFE